MEPCDSEGGVTLDVEEFKSLYPDVTATDAVIESYFSVACLLLDNTKHSRVKNPCERKMLLYLLTRHIAALAEREAGLVGSLTSASQGSVSVGVSAFQNANWYQQTQWGALYWEATGKYRKGIWWYGKR